MGIEIEVAGEVLAEAVIVNEAATPGGAHAGAHAQACANCGAQLAGAYCHHCGQAAHIHHSLLHMFEELLHGLFHFDTKAWRTLPALMFRPGQLTRDYIAGQRTRYVSPLALFLFLIFLMFLVFSVTNINVAGNISDRPQTKTGIDAELTKTRAKLAALESARSRPAPGDEKLAQAEKEIADAKNEIGALETSRKQLDEKTAKKTTGAGAELGDGAKLVKVLARELTEKKVFSAFPRLEQGVSHAADNPELSVYKMKGTAAKFAFLLMPISLPFLWLLFAFRRRFTMFDHAVFSLYSLSFMSVLLMLLAVLGKLGFDTVVAILFLCAPPLHIYSQLRHAYSLTVAAAVWRTAALLLVALCSLLIYALLVAGLSL